jgi:hypothetical protein
MQDSITGADGAEIGTVSYSVGGRIRFYAVLTATGAKSPPMRTREDATRWLLHVTR